MVPAVAALAVPWLPALGAGAGGVAAHVRVSAKVARLRAEADDLLRESGALCHEKAVIARMSAASVSEVTHKLPITLQVDGE